MSEDGFTYPTKNDIVSIHNDIVSEDDNASEGVLNEGDVDFAVNYIEHGHFGRCPETIHEKAVHLMRLLAANHSFADGNKRTALNTTWTFYLINDYYFDYGEEIKAILKMFGVMERMVDENEAKDYFSDIALPIEDANIAEADEALIINKLGEKIFELSEESRKEAEKDEMDIEKIWRLIDDAESYVEKSREIVEGSSKETPTELENSINEIDSKIKTIKSGLQLDASDE